MKISKKLKNFVNVSFMYLFYKEMMVNNYVEHEMNKEKNK